MSKKATYEKIFKCFCSLNEVTVNRKNEKDHNGISGNAGFICLKKKRKKTIIRTEPDRIPQKQLYMLISFVIKKYRITKEKYEADLQILRKFPKFDKSKCLSVIRKFMGKSVREIELCCCFYDCDSREIIAEEQADYERAMKKYNIFLAVLNIFAMGFFTYCVFVEIASIR